MEEMPYNGEKTFVHQIYDYYVRIVFCSERTFESLPHDLSVHMFLNKMLFNLHSMYSHRIGFSRPNAALQSLSCFSAVSKAFLCFSAGLFCVFKDIDSCLISYGIFSSISAGFVLLSAGPCSAFELVFCCIFSCFQRLPALFSWSFLGFQRSCSLLDFS